MVRDAMTPACPVCGSDGQVYKLSQVYVAGITEAADRSPADTELLDAVLGQPGSPAELSELLRSFAPPAVPPVSIPLIHPDLIVLGAFILAAAVVFTLYARASGWFWPAAALGGGLIVVYLAARGAILTALPNGAGRKQGGPAKHGALVEGILLRQGWMRVRPGAGRSFGAGGDAGFLTALTATCRAA